MTQPTEAEIGERSGMGDPADLDMKVEGIDTSADDESDDNDESEDEEASTTVKKAPEESEEDDNDDDDDEESDADKKKRTVPYSRFKSEKTKRQEVEAQLANDRTEMRQAITAITQLTAQLNLQNTTETKPTEDAVKAAAAELANELGDVGLLSAEDLEKVLRKAVKVAEDQFGKKLPQDVQDKLALVDDLIDKKRESDEQALFEGEWDEVLPSIKKAYPNATQAMLDEAKQHMDKLAHSKQFHEVKDLEYVMFKNKSAFDTILTAAPTNKSGEMSKTIGSEKGFDGEDDDDAEIDIEDMTPELMKQRMARARTTGKSTGKDYKIFNPVRTN